MLIPQNQSIAADDTLDKLMQGLSIIIEQSRNNIASYVNQELTMMYWHIGRFILQEINYQDKAEYGKKIVATLSQLLTERYGKGFEPTANGRKYERLKEAEM